MICDKIKNNILKIERIIKMHEVGVLGQLFEKSRSMSGIGGK